MRLAAASLVILSAGVLPGAVIGDWTLNREKSQGPSSFSAGRVQIESDGAGGYQQFSELIHSGADATPPMRFYSRVQLDGSRSDGEFDKQFFEIVSKRLSPDSFEIALADRKTQKVLRTIRYLYSPGTDVLTAEWSNPALKLVYDRVPKGSRLEVGKPVESDFGAGLAHGYYVHLDAAQYCQGKVDQKGGSVQIAVYGPDGMRIRNFGGPPSGSKNFAFQAPVAGDYRIALRSATQSASRYTITIDQISGLESRPQGQPGRERLVSPRIERLKKDLEAGGGAAAVAAFWTEVEKSGTPLVERAKEESSKDPLVTFLWRARGPTRNVLVMWFPFAASKPDDHLMRPIAGTDIWYRTLRIRAGARIAYQLSPNDPLTFDETSTPRMSTAQADPLNRNRWFDNPGGSPLEYNSMVELPEARPQPYIKKRDGVPAGRIDKARIHSELLGNERNLSIYTPPGYRADGPAYGVLFVFDESAYLTLVPTPVILDNLLADGKIKPMVAVLIANPDQEARSRELPPNPKFADFLNNELMSWVRKNYNVTSDPKQIVVAGSSYGGIASVYAGLRHPETFGNILCQSGSFWWKSHKPEPTDEPNYLAREFLKSPKLPIKFYMDAGSFEVDMNGGGGAILEPSRHMRDVLLAKGYEVHYQENVGGHDYLSWRGSLADGLLALVGIR